MIQLKPHSPSQTGPLDRNVGMIRAFMLPMWLRYEAGYILAGLVCIVATICAYIVPHSAHALNPANPPKDVPATYLIAVVVASVCFLFAFSIGNLFGSTSESRAPVVCSWTMFTLPVKTRDLVLIPLVGHIASVLAFWLLFSCAATLPLRTGVPILVPGIAMICSICASHAGTWVFSRSRAAGIFFIVFSVVAPLLAVWGLILRLTTAEICAWALVPIVVSVWAALRTAPSVRHSGLVWSTVPEGWAAAENPAVPLKTRAVKGAALKDYGHGSRRLLELRTPLTVQIWYEQSGKRTFTLPLVCGLVCFLFLAYAFFGHASVPTDELGVGSILVDPSVRTFFWCYPVCLACICIGAASLGYNLASAQNSIFNKFDLDPFVAIRPIPTPKIFWARLFAGAGSAKWTLGVLGVTTLFWLMAPAEERGVPRPLGLLLAEHASFRGALIALVVLLAIPIAVWTCQFGLTVLPVLFGKDWWQKWNRSWQLAGILLVPLYLFLFRHLDTQLPEIVRTWAAPVGVGLLVCKMILVPPGARRLLRSRICSKTVLWKGAAIWAGSFICLTGIVDYLLPRGTMSLSSLALVVALVLPINRIQWQLLTIDLSRHQ